MSPPVSVPDLLYEIEGALKLKKSRPLPAGPLSQTATVKFSSSVSPTTWPVPSNSAPLVGSLQALELVRNALIPVPGNCRTHLKRGGDAVIGVGERPGEIGRHVEGERLQVRAGRRRAWADLPRPRNLHAGGRRAAHREGRRRGAAGGHGNRLGGAPAHRAVRGHAAERHRVTGSREAGEHGTAVDPDRLTRSPVHRRRVAAREARPQGAGRDNEGARGGRTSRIGDVSARQGGRLAVVN